MDEQQLFEELQMLDQIPYHPNVVNLLGGCMDANSMSTYKRTCYSDIRWKLLNYFKMD